MPTVFRFQAYRFFFYSNELGEPPPIHVEGSGFTAKFWVAPVALANSGRFGSTELNRIRDIVILHESKIEEAWRENFNA